MTSVLVTGAGGFIGSHLVERLVREGESVRAFVRYNSRNDIGLLATIDKETLAEVDVFTGDLTNPEAVAGASAGVERIYHLGALIPIPYSYRHPREYIAANVEGTMNVLEAARRYEASRVVQLSTSEVYGTARTVPMSEEHVLHPQSPYAATKVASDQLALSFQRSFDVPVVVCRPFNVYGPRQSARAVVPTIISQALAADVVQLGALSPTRDLTFVTDTAAGIMACGTAPAIGEVVNLGSGKEISVGDLAKLILEVMGRDIPVVSTEERLRPLDSEVERLFADARRAEALLDWRPTVRLEDGLRTTVAWIQREIGRYAYDTYVV